MRRRYEAALAFISELGPTPGLALRQALRRGYGRRDLAADAVAGVVVGIVALPLAMALAIAVGVPPQHGIYTAIIAGALIALLGGSQVQVSGPTAAFVVVLAPIAAKYGIAGLLVAGMMAGVILLIMGLARLGRLIEFIPHPVTTGFTAGIATVIATLQVKDFLGLTPAGSPEHFLERVAALVEALPTARIGDVLVGAITLATLIGWRRVSKKIPAPLVGLVIGTLAALVLARLGWPAATIGSRFSYEDGGVLRAGIPALPPQPLLPWTLPGPGGQPLVVSLELLRELGPSAFAIAMLGAIESLLCAVVADGMAGSKHDPDVELVAQGVGNLVAPFFGGIAATGAIARTATNIRAGGRTPVAAIVHALFVLAGVAVLAPALAYLPMAALAALLVIVAWNMAEAHHFVHIIRVAPKSDTFVLLTCYFLTVIFDMVVSVSAGIMLAALLFMRRMADISHAKLISDEHPALDEPLPRGVLLYEILGPLFFGATQKAMSALENIRAPARVVILHMGAVPAMDVTGLVALESSIEELQSTRHFVILSGVQPQPASVLARAGLVPREGKLAICPTLEEAVLVAKGKRRSTADFMVTATTDPAPP
jgi:SulP family sulfate permease